MRTRSADKKSAVKNQTPIEPPAEPKRTPSRAKQTRDVASKSTPPAEEAKASDADEAVQSTPVAKTASGRKAARRAVRKVVKKSPASSKTNLDKTPRSEDAGMAMLEDSVEEKDATVSKDDHFKEKDAEESKECVKEGDTEDSKEDHVKEEDVLESKESIKEEETEDSNQVPVKEDPKEDPVNEKDLQDPTEDAAKEKDGEDLKEDIVKEGDAEDSIENDMKEKDAEDSKEDLVTGEAAEDSKEPVKEKDAEDSKENAMEEKDAEESKEDLVMGEAAEDSKEYLVKDEDAEGLKEDVAKEKDGEESKEDFDTEEDAEESKENPVEKHAEGSKERPVMEEDAEDSKEDPAIEEDAEDSKEDPATEEDAEDSKENPVMGEDADNSKEDPVKEKDAEDLYDAGPTSMYETNEEIEESSNNLVATAKNVGDSVMEDQNEKEEEYAGDAQEESSNNLVATTKNDGDSVMEDQNEEEEEQAGDAQEEPAQNTLMYLDEVTVVTDVRLPEEIGHSVRTSENQEPTVTYVKSQEPIVEDMKSLDSQGLVTTELKSQESEGSNKGKEGLELRGEKDDGSTPTGGDVNAQCAENRMEEDTDRKMKGKYISLDEAGEDKIEAFADQENDEEYVEDDEPEHCEEAETLEDERAQLNALTKERKKRKELEVFVGGLDRDAVEEDLKRAFQHVGEVIDVRMNKELSTNKNKGYAFVKFATKEQVSRALAEMRNPVIRGKRCGTSPSEDNDTLFLGNICNTWTKEAVRLKLKDYGVEGVENINLVADPKREGLSRGFAFLEFSCHTDALTAYKRLQRPDVVFGHSERTAKIAFAEPLRDPDPEVMAQVKSVFIDGLPPYWDEDRVREKFKCFGEIARITLARNISTAKRKDFGFVDFGLHEAAVACVEGVNNTELGDGNLKAKVRARLSNPQPKTQAVKGGMSGGFRISRGPMGRGFLRGHSFGRAIFPRGRGFHPRRPGHVGRMGFTEHEFGSPYPPFRGRSNAGRGGRWNFSGAHPVSSEGPMFVDRMRHQDRGHADDAFFRRQQFPIEGLNRPFMDRRFEDRYHYDNTNHGLKRPFSMTDLNPDYLGPSRRPRFDHSDSASSLQGDRYRDNFPPGGELYTRDYYGADYGRGQYPSFYGGGRPYGRGYGRGHY
ncbi:putative peptidyl-prolyl cis-trans isomerase Pin1-like [Capsicum annuum]|nr:putative peptidyl-prolyl cis-trans isomerase Pin1-like [Capsicum annuum]